MIARALLIVGVAVVLTGLGTWLPRGLPIWWALGLVCGGYLCGLGTPDRAERNGVALRTGGVMAVVLAGVWLAWTPMDPELSRVSWSMRGVLGLSLGAGFGGAAAGLTLIGLDLAVHMQGAKR